MEASVDRDVLDTPEAGPLAIRGGVLRIGGYVLGSLLSVISAALLTRHLGAADFGRYAAVFSLITVVTGIADAGTANIGVREYSVRRGEEGRTFLAHLMGIRILLAVLGGLAAVAFSLAAGYDSEMIAGAGLAGVGLVIATVGGTLAVPLQSLLRLGWVTNLEVLRQAATVALIVALVLAGAGIVPLLAVPIPVGLLVIVVTVALVRSHAGLRPRADREAWRRLVALTLPYAAATAIGIFYAHTTVLALSIASTERETGLFSAAFRVYFVLATIPGLLVSSAFPILARAARDDRDRLRYAVQRLLDASLVFGGGMALVTAVGAPVAIAIVAGGEYDASVSVLRVLAIAILGTFLIAVGGFALLSLERYRALIVANLTGLALSAGITLTLAPSLGADAGAIAVVTGDLVLGSLYFLVLARAGDVTPRWTAALKAALAAAVAVALVLVTGLPAVPATLLAGGVFCALLVPLRAIPDEVLEALTGWRSRSG